MLIHSGPEHRAPVALLDVLPAQVPPERTLPPAAAQVVERATPAARPGHPSATGGAVSARVTGCHRLGHGARVPTASSAGCRTQEWGAAALEVLARAPAEPLRSACCPPGHPAAGPRRICSSCARAAICWANSAVWMPWNRPSSQPTSWACAIRSSARTGCRPRRTAAPAGAAPSRSSGARPSSSSLMEFSWISLSRSGGLVERCGADLFEQLLDHGADPHDLGGLFDHAADRPLLVAVLGWAPWPCPTGRPSGPTTITCCSPFSPCSGFTCLHRLWPHRGQRVRCQQHLADDAALVEQRVRGGGVGHRHRACTTGRTRPSAIIGHTCSRTAGDDRALAVRATGRPRRLIAITLAPLAQQLADVELAPSCRPACR